MPITNGYCTLAQIKAFKDITSVDSVDDGVLEDMITQASRLFDNETNRTFYARTETHYYDVPKRRLSLWIDDDDLLSITSLTNGDGTVITSAQYKLYPLNSSPKFEIRLLPSSNVYWTWTTAGDFSAAITVVGTWGFSATAPADVTAAVEEIVIGAYGRRYGNNTAGAAAATITGAGVVITPRDITQTAQRAINNYMRHG